MTSAPDKTNQDARHFWISPEPVKSSLAYQKHWLAFDDIADVDHDYIHVIEAGPVLARIEELEKELEINKITNNQGELHHNVIRQKLKIKINELEARLNLCRKQRDSNLLWAENFEMLSDVSNEQDKELDEVNI